MNRRFLAVTALLAMLSIVVNGCATNSSGRQYGGSQVVKQQASPATQSASHNGQRSGGILSEVESPKIASATKFADAPSAEESIQVKSMREQMARRYGCCGK